MTTARLLASGCLAGNTWRQSLQWLGIAALAPFENPIVLVTRPAESGARFVEALHKIAGPFRALISPAFEIEPLPYDQTPFDAAIFTSKAGVAYAEDGRGRTAWCVGPATAEAADAKGYRPQVGSGNAEDLVRLILSKQPEDFLVHFRGENVRLNVTEVLSQSGINCSEVTIYRKAIQKPREEMTIQITHTDTVIIPLFSAETVSILREWDIDFQRAIVVAISDEVAEAAKALDARQIYSSKHANLNEMTRATARLIA